MKTLLSRRVRTVTGLLTMLVIGPLSYGQGYAPPMMGIPSKPNPDVDPVNLEAVIDSTLRDSPEQVVVACSFTAEGNGFQVPIDRDVLSLNVTRVGKEWVLVQFTITISLEGKGTVVCSSAAKLDLGKRVLLLKRENKTVHLTIRPASE